MTWILRIASIYLTKLSWNDTVLQLKNVLQLLEHLEKGQHLKIKHSVIMYCILEFQRVKPLVSLPPVSVHVPAICDSSISKVVNGQLGFNSQKRLEILLFTTASRPALEPTQRPIQYIPTALSLGVKQQRREADHSPLAPMLRMGGTIPSFTHTSSWRGV